MKINEILLESEVQHLEEGPILNKIGSAVGKGVGALAKGAGAVAGGVAGLGTAAKKGFQAGKQTVAGAGDDPAADQEQPAQQPQSFMAGLKQGLSGKKSTAAPTAADINKAGPKGTAPAKQQSGAGAQALQKTAQAAGGDPEKAGQTLYAQVKSQVGQLDKKGKQRIMQLLQKSLAQPAASGNAAQPAAGSGAMGQMANQLANTGTSSTGGKMQGTATGVKNTANPNNPNNQQAAAQPDDLADISDAEIAKSTAAKTDDQLSTYAGRANLNPRVKASVDAEIAKRGSGKKPIKIAGTKQAPAAQPQQLAASKENTGTMVAESFSLFRKR